MKFPRKIITLIFLFCLFGLLLLLPNLVKIGEIECHSQYGGCNGLIVDRLEAVKKTGILATIRGVKKYLERESLIRDFQVFFKIPDKLEVYVIEKKPKFGITTNKKEAYALVDKDGYVLSFAENSNLPSVSTLEELPEIGSSTSPESFFALNLMYDVYSLYQVNEGTIEDDSLVIELDEGLRVIFPLEGNKEELMGSLILLYNEISYESESLGISQKNAKIKVIDLRFKNPILK